jgi:hypothetical protein
MSNALINFHVEDGLPAGGGASFENIAEHYGNQLFGMREVIAAMVDWLNCVDTPEEWMRCRDRAKKALERVDIDWRTQR